MSTPHKRPSSRFMSPIGTPFDSTPSRLSRPVHLTVSRVDSVHGLKNKLLTDPPHLWLCFQGSGRRHPVEEPRGRPRRTERLPGRDEQLPQCQPHPLNDQQQVRVLDFRNTHRNSRKCHYLHVDFGSSSSISGRQLCNAITKTGKPCKKRAVPGQEYCRVHDDGHVSYVTTENSNTARGF